ncbi:sensory rhodopsin transducer [Natronobacterium texcoconense]|uniref:Sensory rhodopsin transducer n=1 Tax=Natronobacterium texcoconense TaxID=1095778 RepID=A0A1H1ESH2_NATTX|nr:sensory rhodopsin transducer [Natronobacterium texcoconense]SDQ91707.1 Anabaena sensory rhodopsin transducer [Natronobacterium texcoconense]
MERDEKPDEEWTNWSGSISFEPDRIVEPESEEEVGSIVLESNVPIVVQWSRQDTRQTENAGLSTIVYGE